MGIGLLGIATALLLLRVWFAPERRDDYLLWAVACFSFFILPTQIHERYLYPAMVFLALALIKDWRALVVYGVVAVAFTANVLMFAVRGNRLLNLVGALLNPAAADGLGGAADAGLRLPAAGDASAPAGTAPTAGA